MKLSRFIIVKLTCFLILGIYLGYTFNFPLLFCVFISIGLLFALTFVYIQDRNRFTTSIWFGLFTYLLTIFIGIVTLKIHDDRLSQTHYTHLTNKSKTITFQIADILKPNTFYNKYIVRVVQIDNKSVTGKALLHVKNNSALQPLEVDDCYITTANLIPLSKPLNPDQFDYSAFLHRKNIYSQINSSKLQLLKIKKNKTTLHGIASKIRSGLIRTLETYEFDTEQLAVLKALLLGQRDDIPDELYKNYTKSGTIHILAVSGLHVGILLLLLHFLLSPLNQIRRYRFIKPVCIILLLWSFAFITGLSPSVCRATTMFSLLAVSLNKNRPTNIFNTIAISAFILLLINPMFLFDVGFQLSYLAVLGIVIFQPRIYSLFIPQYKILNFLWNTLSVTLAAQLGVLPLSLYYFHLLPGLFFLSNLIVVPLITVILPLGILVLLVSSIGLTLFIPVYILNQLLLVLNRFINWIAQQNVFILDELFIPLNAVLAIYVILISALIYYEKHSYKSIVIFLTAIIMLQLTLIHNTFSVTVSEWILFHKNRQSLLVHKYNKQLHLYHSGNNSKIKQDIAIKNYSIKNNLKSSTATSLTPIYTINNKQLLVVDSTGIFPETEIKIAYVLLSHSPKINLDRLIETLAPEQIIADGSNYTYLLKQWEETCKYKSIPFHQTYKNGAYYFK